MNLSCFTSQIGSTHLNSNTKVAAFPERKLVRRQPGKESEGRLNSDFAQALLEDHGKAERGREITGWEAGACPCTHAWLFFPVFRKC